jgi:GT2 family glycosyltransferase
VSTAADRVTIVIVNYESYPELRDCLASLTADADAGHEIVVVDHVSREGAADALSREFPFVRLLRVPANEGFAAGVNRGARGAQTPFLLLLNPDSIVDAGLVDRLSEWMHDRPDVGVVGPRLLNADGSVQGSARRFPDVTTVLAGRSSWLTRVLPRNPLSRRNLPAVEAMPGHPMDVDWISGACMMIRRAAFEQVAGMDEGFFLYWEDADFCRRLKSAGWRTMYVPKAGAMHIGGRSSRHAADASLEAFHASAYRLYSKHAGAAAQLLRPVVFLGLRLRLAMMKRIVRRRQASNPETRKNG